MRCRVLSAGVLTAALLVFGSTASSAAPLRALSATADFADGAGDSAAAPDVTAVTISNDDQGLISFRITIPNRTALGPNDAIGIPIATDDPNAIRGRRDGDGATFVLGLDGQSAFLLAWNGVEMAEVNPRPPSVTGSFSAGVATITVRQEDLAPGFPDMSVPVALNFYVLGIAFNGSDVLAQDEAPDGSALWSFRLGEPVRLIVTSFAPKSTVKGGETLVVRMGLAHGDTGAAVRSGRVVCSARAGGRALRGTGGFSTIRLKVAGVPVQSRTASCSWKIPKTAKAKTVTGAVTVVQSGLRVSRSFSTRVR
jgi:hypothetical protein